MTDQEKVEILRLNQNDLILFKETIALLNEVFEEYQTIAKDSHLQKLLDKPEFYVVVATKNGILIGGLTAYEFQRYYSDSSELYIYDLAVKTELQNQGVGKKLISFLKEYAEKSGIETIFVEAHSEDIQAVKFYETTFGISEKVDHFNLELNN